jgi:(4S)-4-hydroxy-5-phosphonooxypentane-2,3-dione isomerase
MSKLAIFGTIEVVPGNRERILAALRAHKARAIKDEPGTLQFDILAPRDDETRILLCEIYQDDQAFETHRSAPSVVRFREETAGTIAALHVTRCALVE